MPDMGQRLGTVRDELKRRGVDGLFVTDIANIRYLTGFTGSSAYLLITGGHGWFLTDSRYGLQARDEVKGFKIKVYARKALDAVATLVTGAKLKTLGFERKSLSYDSYLGLKKALSGTRLRSLSGIVEARRAVKDCFEIGRIRKAIEIANAGFIAARKGLTSGRTEKEVVHSIEAAVKRKGAEALSFETIVLSGKRGAFPHGKPSDKRVKRGALVVVDLGVTLEGYCSDETRTYIVGSPTRMQKKVYRVVKDAHDRAIEKVMPGVKASVVDMAARSYIKKAGYGRYFGHGTGHGVGLNIHEDPVIGPMNNDVITEGMVFTIEPGVYIPGWGGVRIEDMVLVTAYGSEILTKGSDKELCCLG
jgi:Xaa-Pro aminopeptidase